MARAEADGTAGPRAVVSTSRPPGSLRESRTGFDSRTTFPSGISSICSDEKYRPYLTQPFLLDETPISTQLWSRTGAILFLQGRQRFSRPGLSNPRLQAASAPARTAPRGRLQRQGNARPPARCGSFPSWDSRSDPARDPSDEHHFSRGGFGVRHRKSSARFFPLSVNGAFPPIPGLEGIPEPRSLGGTSLSVRRQPAPPSDGGHRPADGPPAVLVVGHQHTA